MKKRYLILENGKIFEGEGFGADVTSVGELVFNTGMCGYIETLTDPAYCGQIIMQTFPLIGNYGIIESDFEGGCFANGYVVREYSKTPSNFRTDYDIDTYLKRSGVPGICGLDTRELTKIIRETGVMNAMICDTLPPDMSDIKKYKITDTVRNVSRKAVSEFKSCGRYNVALIDYGTRTDVIGTLNKFGCDVTVCPFDTPAETVLEKNYDGVVLSNGPGDPADNSKAVGEIKKIFGKTPILAIGLGHQLLAMSQGGKTEKMKYGHRGGNQPVKDVRSGRTYVTSQNHGYSVVNNSVKNGKISFVNVNDGTCEGIDYSDNKAISVQFYPDSECGPCDTGYVFSDFCKIMGGDN